MASRTDLVRKIMKQMGTWQVGQDLPPEDYRSIDEELPTRLLAMSKAKIYNATVDYIPDEAADAIAAYLASRMGVSHGVVGEELVAVQAEGLRAEAELRDLNKMDPTYSRARAEYF